MTIQSSTKLSTWYTYSFYKLHLDWISFILFSLFLLTYYFFSFLFTLVAYFVLLEPPTPLYFLSSLYRELYSIAVGMYQVNTSSRCFHVFPLSKVNELEVRLERLGSFSSCLCRMTTSWYTSIEHLRLKLTILLSR